MALRLVFDLAGACVRFGGMRGARLSRRVDGFLVLGSLGWQVHGSIRFAPPLKRLFLLSYSEPDLTPLASLPSLVSVVMKDYPALPICGGVGGAPVGV